MARGVTKLEVADGIGEELAQVGQSSVKRNGSRFESGEVEQIRDEAAQPLDLLRHAGEQFGSRLSHVVEEVLKRCPQTGQRCA